MSIYKAVGSAAVAARTMLTLVSAAAIRPRLIAAVYSNIGAVSLDSQWQVTGQRFTAAGTTTAVTPAATDPNDPASTLTAGSNATVEPTYTANTIFTSFGINPRSTYRWVAYDPRDEIIMPATAANGLGFNLAVLGGAVLGQVEATVLQ
jgi:hypothetical protein